MGKWAKYDKTFQNRWLKDPLFRKWIEEVKTDGTKAYCKLCKTELRAHKNDLRKHAESLKHKQNSQFISVKQVFVNINKPCLSRLELKLAVFIACHSSIQSIDHLSQLIKDDMPSTSSTDCLRLHRTKCALLIKNVIGPELLKEQIIELNKVAFSLIIDESTDIACIKHLCVCVRYYNTKENRIVSQFLGLIHVVETKADALYKYVKEFFTNIGVNLNNCFAIATDGASNLCGNNHSLFTLMKEEIPTLILIKCVCHSLHLACSQAYEELPSHLDYMLRETYNWFHRSALRRESYMEIYKLLNDGKDPLRIIPLSSTRWLARSNCIKRIVAQWESLKLHFKTASLTHDKYVARELFSMYSDPLNELYFAFVTPILLEFEKINFLFQSDHADHCKLQNDLETFTLCMLRRILHPQSVDLGVDMEFKSIFLPIDRVDFGHVFSIKLEQKVKCKEISLETKKNILERCHKFLKQACKELLNRISGNLGTLKKIKNMSPNICLSHTRPSFSKLPLELANKTELEEIETQWRQLLNIDWKCIFPSGDIPNDGSKFWGHVVTMKNAGGEVFLKDIALFALKVYSLPISNATIERVFSRVTSTKTKLRNRMGLNLLTSILRIKMILEEKSICCYNFEPSSAMLSYNSNIYNESSHNTDEKLDELEEELLKSIQL